MGEWEYLFPDLLIHPGEVKCFLHWITWSWLCKPPLMQVSWTRTEGCSKNPEKQQPHYKKWQLQKVLLHEIMHQRKTDANIKLSAETAKCLHMISYSWFFFFPNLSHKKRASKKKKALPVQIIRTTSHTSMYS